MDKSGLVFLLYWQLFSDIYVPILFYFIVNLIVSWNRATSLGETWLSGPRCIVGFCSLADYTRFPHPAKRNTSSNWLLIEHILDLKVKTIVNLKMCRLSPSVERGLQGCQFCSFPGTGLQLKCCRLSRHISKELTCTSINTNSFLKWNNAYMTKQLYTCLHIPANWF